MPGGSEQGTQGTGCVDIVHRMFRLVGNSTAFEEGRKEVAPQYLVLQQSLGLCLQHSSWHNARVLSDVSMSVGGVGIGQGRVPGSK